MNNNEEAKTIDAKHLFIDIVNYTYNRSVEAQTELIKILNDIVNETIDFIELDRENVLFIPTGDGMCITLINILNPFDIHIQIGLILLEKLEKKNQSQTDNMRKFSMRIGINENIDNLIIDINKQRNVSGSGINMASRIEGLADKNQILVGNSVFDKLIQREKYMNSFVSFSANVKHGVQLKVHQYINKSLSYLNSEIPSEFKVIPKREKQLSELEGSYLANCIQNEEFISSKLSVHTSTYSLHVLLFQYTLDCIEKSKTTKVKQSYTRRIPNTLEKYFEHLQSVNIWIRHDYRQWILNKELKEIRDCFEEEFLIINNKGLNRLKEEQPNIYETIKNK